jgi:hypothetical protein
MKYLKSILVGAASSVVTVIVFSILSVVLMSRFPEIALRIFPAQRHELGWGAFYDVAFPLWPAVTVGLLAFATAFSWMLRRASA